MDEQQTGAGGGETMGSTRAPAPRECHPSQRNHAHQGRLWASVITAQAAYQEGWEGVLPRCRKLSALPPLECMPSSSSRAYTSPVSTFRDDRADPVILSACTRESKRGALYTRGRLLAGGYSGVRQGYEQTVGRAELRELLGSPARSAGAGGSGGEPEVTCAPT
jgi:hypothetical protein